MIERGENKNSMSISDIRKIISGCSGQLYADKMTESETTQHQINNLGEGFALHAFVIDSA